MEHTFQVRVSQRDADIALRRFLLRQAGWGSLACAALCLAFVGYDWSDGVLSGLGIVVLTVMALLGAAYGAAYVIRRRQTAELLNKIGDEPICYTLNESEFSSKAPLGSSTLRWEMVKQLWVGADVVMVFYARNGYTTIPTGQIPESALAFLEEQVSRAGGAVFRSKGAPGKPR